MKDKRYGKGNQNRPTKILYLSHHDRAPGEWMRHGDKVNHKVRNHPSLDQYDRTEK